MAVSPLYIELMQAFDARRRGLGWSMAKMDDMSGLQDGYFAKCLHAGRPSGRRAGWEMLGLMFTALWRDGARLAVLPANRPPAAEREARAIDPVRPGAVAKCVYAALLEQIDARRRALGLTATDVDQRSGVRPLGTLWRALLPEGDSRREVVEWDVMDLWRQALWPAGVRVAVFSDVPTTRRASNDNGEQLALDLEVAGPHATLTIWRGRRRKPRKYTPGGCDRRRAA
ncbi:hypothetical protein [Azospirillum rugosum]|uniref:Uncharacterized protein n=1 Tax=Azospirillum rugosum TaxID=416170 RepID=A0ABS4SRJ5_9PROT|nr:hypothetical protein [Azospirillum rugosum]MBP2294713.1 hypothetical protein [Azospirillum rugosum]MDQ0527998.1 hypothetical protein [Azospirillum rugosum]